MKRIGILTSGGDCPGLNAVIRAVVKKATQDYGYDVIGIEDGFGGLIRNKHRKLTDKNVSGILTLGGTILGTNRLHPDIQEAARGFRRLKIDCLVCVGGDGTLRVASHLSKAGVPLVGVPKTIDNDVKGTDITFGFDTAVHIATEGVDRLHTTAESHHRVMILEVMGRRGGWIALYAGLAGGGDIILIPEIPYDIKLVADSIAARRKKGKRFTIVVVAEGAKPRGGNVDLTCGISFALGKEIERLTGIETRNVVMGHLQRGGSPSPFDRILGTQLGSHAVDFIVNKQFGHMVGVKKDTFVKVPLAKVAQGQRLVPVNHPLIKTARSLGTCFGIC